MKDQFGHGSDGRALAARNAVNQRMFGTSGGFRSMQPSVSNGDAAKTLSSGTSKSDAPVIHSAMTNVNVYRDWTGHSSAGSSLVAKMRG